MATDGQSRVRLIWVKTNEADDGTDVYWWDLRRAGLDAHYSYHKSGERHWKIMGQVDDPSPHSPETDVVPVVAPYVIRIMDAAPPTELKGLQKLAAWTFLKDWPGEPGALPWAYKADEDFLIDMRTIKGPTIFIQLLAMEPGRLDLLPGLRDDYPGCSVDVLKETRPWLAVVVGRNAEGVQPFDQ